MFHAEKKEVKEMHMFDLMRRIRKLQQKRIDELTLETEEQSQVHLQTSLT